MLAILALVSGIAGPRVMGLFGKAKSRTAVVEMRQIKAALDIFNLENGRYPTNEEGLAALVSAPPAAPYWAGPYLESENGLSDPWGETYRYRAPSGDRGLQIISFGADRAEGGSGENADIRVPSS